MASSLGSLVNNPNDATIQGTPPIDFGSIANSLSYVSAQFPQAAPLVNILTQQVANYAGNWKYYQQNMAQKTAGMPTGQAQDFMAQQGIAYSMQSLQQLQGLITGILPYMTQEMILQFQDKWFQQEMQLKQKENAQQNFMSQAGLNSQAFQQLNNPNSPFSIQGMNATNAATDAANANQPGTQISANPQTAQQAASKYMSGLTYAGQASNGQSVFIDPSSGSATLASFDPNAPQGTNPFTTSSTLSSSQAASMFQGTPIANLINNATTQASAAVQAGQGFGGSNQGGASLQGTTPNAQGGQSQVGSPDVLNSMFGPLTSSTSSTGGNTNTPNTSLFGPQTGASATTGQATPAQTNPTPQTTNPASVNNQQSSIDPNAPVFGTGTPSSTNNFLSAFGGGQ
jgi:hypothetical protein